MKWMWSLIIKGPHASPAAAQNVLPLVLLLHGDDARPAGHLLNHQHRAAAPDAAFVIVQLFLWTFVHFWKLCTTLFQRQTFHSLRFSVKETLLCWCTLLCPFLGKVLTKTFTAQLTPKELSFMHHSKQILWDEHLTAASLRLQRWIMARRSVTQTRSFFDLAQFSKLFKAFNL